MKTTVAILFVLLITGFATAQGSLQFSQAKVVSSIQTVPAGKVWKVTSVYGQDYTCVFLYSGSYQYHGKYLASGFKINGVNVFSYKTWIQQLYEPGCTTKINGVDWNTIAQLTTVDLNNVPNNGNIFPVWLPAGTTLEGLGANTFLSVVEFNVIP
jgi:hypothetical protein